MSTVTLENWMGLHVDLHVQISGGATIGTRLALAGQANSITHVDSGWHLHRQRFMFFDSACTRTGIARIRYDFSAAAATRTGLL
jgi:hypothetical protein